MAPKFEILEHPADIGFFAYGTTLEELFANAALAMISIAGDIAAVREVERREIEAIGEDASTGNTSTENALIGNVSAGNTGAENTEGENTPTGKSEGENTESLLYAWLAEILAVMDAERLALARVEVTQLGGGRVRGVVYGEYYDRARHRAGVAIKAVTYHQFAIERTQDGWRARVFLDL